MTAFSYPHFRNGERIDLEEIPRLLIGDFRNTVIQAVHDGGRLLNLFAETHDEVPFLVGIISLANSGGPNYNYYFISLHLISICNDCSLVALSSQFPCKP